MGRFDPIFTRFKVSCHQVSGSTLNGKSSPIRPAADTPPRRGFQPSPDFGPVDPIPILELPANSTSILQTLCEVAELPTKTTMLLKDMPTKALYGDSPSPKDRWLGHKLLETTISIAASRSAPAHVSNEEIEKLYQEMKESFRYEQCFKQLCNEQGIEREGSNYCHLLESMLGHICLRGQNNFQDIVSTIEYNITDPRYNGDQKDVVEPPQHNICYSTQEASTSGSASEDVTTERESTSDANQSTGNILEEHISEPLPAKASEELRRLLQDHIDADDLPRYTQVVQEFCRYWGEEASYTWAHRGLPHLRKFQCTVTLEGLKAVGSECRSKQEAKHEASKVLWKQLKTRIQA